MSSIKAHSRVRNDYLLYILAAAVDRKYFCEEGQENFSGSNLL